MKRLLAAMALSIMCATPSPALEVYNCQNTGSWYLTPKGFLYAWFCAGGVVVLSRDNPQPIGTESRRETCGVTDTLTHKGVVYDLLACGDTYVLNPIGEPA